MSSKSIAIIGAGITGLTAAFYVKRRGVLAAVDKAGTRSGVIRSIHDIAVSATRSRQHLKTIDSNVG